MPAISVIPLDRRLGRRGSGNFVGVVLLLYLTNRRIIHVVDTQIVAIGRIYTVGVASCSSFCVVAQRHARGKRNLRLSRGGGVLQLRQGLTPLAIGVALPLGLAPTVKFGGSLPPSSMLAFSMESVACLKSDSVAAFHAALRTCRYIGTLIDARMPMIITTTSNSMRVKPDCPEARRLRDRYTPRMASPLFLPANPPLGLWNKPPESSIRSHTPMRVLPQHHY